MDRRATYHFRLDGLEAMVFAVAFMAAVIGLMVLGLKPSQPRLLAPGALALGFSAVWVLRRVRPTRVATPRTGENPILDARSLGSLILLAVGWFVLAIAALAVLIAASILSDPKFRDASALLLPAVPLLVGGALVYAGLRVGKPSNSQDSSRS